jgi:hypothetical protein
VAEGQRLQGLAAQSQLSIIIGASRTHAHKSK